LQFLVDASMPRSTAPLIQARGHSAIDVRDIGLGGSPDQSIAAHAQLHQFAIATRDFDFADVRVYPPNQYAGIIVIDLPTTATPRP
jgi:predicted nuclease of predicted toxin-antitoxin system